LSSQKDTGKETIPKVSEKTNNIACRGLGIKMSISSSATWGVLRKQSGGFQDGG
jgi:hypothetical protein